MKELGEFLKKSRINSGISLEEVSEDLNINKEEIENLEEGNIRAFKDIYVLKDIVIKYSKYLGINTDKVLDEFNDFMFEYTSKISLEDIKEARKQVNLEFDKPKIRSPYTYKPKKKIKINDKLIKKIFFVLIIIILIICLYNLISKNINKDQKISQELFINMEEIHEYTK